MMKGRLAKLKEKLSGTLRWMSTLADVERSYKNKLTLHLSQINFRVFLRRVSKTIICSDCASLRQSLLCALIYN